MPLKWLKLVLKNLILTMMGMSHPWKWTRIGQWETLPALWTYSAVKNLKIQWVYLITKSFIITNEIKTRNAQRWISLKFKIIIVILINVPLVITVMITKRISTVMPTVQSQTNHVVKLQWWTLILMNPFYSTTAYPQLIAKHQSINSCLLTKL